MERAEQTKTIKQEEDETEIEPTNEELTTLEHICDRIPLTAWYIVICEFCERFAFIGLFGPFQNYVQFPVPGPHDKQPGALGRGHRIATLLTTFFQFLCYFTPIIAAILADQVWGKYKTIVRSCIVYVFGLSLLVLTSTPFSIQRGIAFPGFIVTIIILAFAAGGVKSNVSPLMGQQYTRKRPIIKEIKGIKKIIDPKVTLQSMFTWFYWTINMGSFGAIITTNIEKYYAFWLAYLVPAVVFIGCIIVLVLGRHQYIETSPSGSLILRAYHLIVKAIRIRYKFGKKQHCQHILDYSKEDHPLPINCSGKEMATALDQDRFIDELKQVWNACPIFACFPFYWICSNQLNSNLISQAAQMDVGVLPNDVLHNITAITALILIPIFDKFIYPTLRKFKINFTPIRRIFCGFFFASFSMAWTAFVQYKIYSTGPNYNYSIKPCSTCQKFNNISVAWQVPAYIFMGIAEILSAITGLEYAYTQAPSSMKSIIVSVYFFTAGIGSALNFTLLPVIVDPKLLWMYASLSIATFIIGIVILVFFRNSKEKNNPEVNIQ